MTNITAKAAMIFATTVISSFSGHAIEGSWRGNLDLGQAKLPLVLNFSNQPDGTATCTMDSPMQGATGIPTELLYCSADSVALTIKAIGAEYSARVQAGEMTGTFRQRGFSFPLTMTMDDPLDDRRPQTPKPPFPYTEQDTTFISYDGTVLSGTLTLPAESGKGQSVPGVVLVTGSGPQNRDEALFEHKPFAVIADFLARNGIAVFRYDDRGTAASQGDFNSATTETFKKDAASALSFLRSVKGIDKVGVAGHSEGGTIGFMLGAEGCADFVVSLAGMAVSGKEVLLAQNRHSLEKSGLSAQEISDVMTLLEKVFDEIASQVREGKQLPIDADAIAGECGLNINPMVMGQINQTCQTRSPWMDMFISLDARPFLEKLRCPLLAVNGDKDTQVNGSINLAEVKRLAPDAEVQLMPGLNHMMQHCETGEVLEYQEIRETFSPEVLDMMVRFIKGAQQKL